MVRLFESVDGRLGPIAALVNNAGILERQTRVEDIDAARLASHLRDQRPRRVPLRARSGAADVDGARRHAAGRSSTSRRGAAQLGAPGEYVDYAASKAALDALTIGLAREVAGEGIRVNGVRAGIIYTDIHAAAASRIASIVWGRPCRCSAAATPIEVARAILWLLSDEASYSTGTFIDVSGGQMTTMERKARILRQAQDERSW